MLRINFLLIIIILIASTAVQTQRNPNYGKKQAVPFFRAVNEDTSLYLAKENYWLKQDSVWFVNTITNYKYDGNGNNIEEVSKYFNPNYNTPTEIYKRIYDNNNRLIDEILLHNNYGRLDSIQRQTYFYDSLLTMKIIYELFGDDLRQSWRTKYFYDSKGNLVEEIDQQNSGFEWSDEYKNTYSYDVLGKKVNSNEYQYYNQSWNLTAQDSFFYDQFGRIIEDRRFDQTGMEFLIYQTKYDSLTKGITRYSYYESEMDLLEDARWTYNYNSDSTLKEILAYENIDDLQELSRKWEYFYAPLSQLTNVGDNNLTLSFYLMQNYPNPFNPKTKIQYELLLESQVILKIYDILGREIATLVNEEKPAGGYEAQFDGSGLASGIYFYELEAGNYSSVKKMILLK
jgi:YD repeat-containing protein